jgi:hypothetical protein
MAGYKKGEEKRVKKKGREKRVKNKRAIEK